MARVIVIVGLMLVITVAMFALTRRSPVPPGEAATEASTTVHLGASPDSKIDDAPSPTSVGPRLVANADAPASAQDVAAGRLPNAAPTFGTAGVDHKGYASFTGTAKPGDLVTLLLDGKSLGAAKADDRGSWSIAVKAPSTELHLQVSAQGKDGKVIIGLERAVIRPSPKLGELPRVTLKSADEAAAPLENTAAAPEPKTGLIVEKVTGGAEGQAMLLGRADPGATVKASINGKPAGETQVAADGTWTLAASNPSRKVGKQLRLELIDKDGGTLDQTNVPYEIAAAPQVVAADTKLAADFSSVLTSKPAARPTRAAGRKSKHERAGAALIEPSAAVDEPRRPRIIKVRRGDSLWRISRRHLGNGKRWASFYKANKAKIDNPDLIFPGQTLVLPG